MTPIRQARALPILMYHHVSPKPGLVTVSPQTFRTQMGWLRDNDWHSVGGDELSAFLEGKPLVEKSVMITFDDGYLDNWIHAHPVLQEYGLSAAIFLVTGWVGDGAARPHAVSAGSTPDCPSHKDCLAAIRSGATDQVVMNWQEVAAMREAGTAEFHSHIFHVQNFGTET